MLNLEPQFSGPHHLPPCGWEVQTSLLRLAGNCWGSWSLRTTSNNKRLFPKTAQSKAPGEKNLFPLCPHNWKVDSPHKVALAGIYLFATDLHLLKSFPACKNLQQFKLHFPNLGSNQNSLLPPSSYSQCARCQIRRSPATPGGRCCSESMLWPTWKGVTQTPGIATLACAVGSLLNSFESVNSAARL